MTDYVQQTDFSIKDALSTGDPNKKVKGVEFDVEFASIAAAITSKQDSSERNSANGYAGLGGDGTLLESVLPFEFYFETITAGQSVTAEGWAITENEVTNTVTIEHNFGSIDYAAFAIATSIANMSISASQTADHVTFKGWLVSSGGTSVVPTPLTLFIIKRK